RPARHRPLHPGQVRVGQPRLADRGRQGDRTRWPAPAVAGLVLLGLGLRLAAPGDGAAARAVILATTTSTQDSGLLDVLVPLFERRTGYPVRAVAVGTGAALRLGADGDADVVLVHAPALEREYLAKGMVDTLTIASEKLYYTLTDRETYLAFRRRVELRIVLEGEPALANVYHVLRPDPSRTPRVNDAGGRSLDDFLVSSDAKATTE